MPAFDQFFKIGVVESQIVIFGNASEIRNIWVRTRIDCPPYVWSSLGQGSRHLTVRTTVPLVLLLYSARIAQWNTRNAVLMAILICTPGEHAHWRLVVWFIQQSDCSVFSLINNDQ
jgi:hypothetical protein